MKAAVFDYTRPKDLGEALKALASMPGEAKPIAGGQSLGPMLNLRLARPKLLVDVSQIVSLKDIKDEGNAWRIGASVTHAQLEDRPLAGCEPLAKVARVVAYRAVRNRGTVGGSLAHADPAADWPLVFATLDAVVRVAGPSGTREIKADAFMTAAFTTPLADDEIVESVTVPKLGAGARWGYYKFCRKTGEFPEAAAALLLAPARRVARGVAGALAPGSDGRASGAGGTGSSSSCAMPCQTKKPVATSSKAEPTPAKNRSMRDPPCRRGI